MTDIKDIVSLLHAGESQAVEFKSSFDRETIETVVAFANAGGGTVLIGVADAGSIKEVTVGKVSFKQAGGINEGINEGVNEGVKLLLGLITAHPGINGPELSQRLKIPPKTLERWLKQLKDKNKIEHRGSRKTGGYHITDVKVDP